LLLEGELARRVDRTGVGLGLRQRSERGQPWPGEPCGQRHRHGQDRQDDLDASARILGRGADGCGPSENWGKPREERRKAPVAGFYGQLNITDIIGRSCDREPAPPVPARTKTALAGFSSTIFRRRSPGPTRAKSRFIESQAANTKTAPAASCAKNRNPVRNQNPDRPIHQRRPTGETSRIAVRAVPLRRTQTILESLPSTMP